MVQILDKNELIYGQMPKRPLHLSVRPILVNEVFLDGRAIFKCMEMLLEFDDGITTIPFNILIPNTATPCPTIVIIDDNENLSEKSIEFVNKGYAVFSVFYKNISKNDGNFKSGISAYISPSRRKKSSAGKLTVWAWAAIRLLEYAEDLEEINKNNIGIYGEGILGLSATLAKATCDRFTFVMTEDLPTIDERFALKNPHLFSPNYSKSQCLTT